MQRLRLQINRALAPMPTAHKQFSTQWNEFVKAVRAVRTAPPEPEGFSCGRCSLTKETADKCTRPIYYITLVVCFPFMLSWNLEQASLLSLKSDTTTTTLVTNTTQSTPASIFHDMCFDQNADQDWMNWLYVFVGPGLVSGIPAFLAFIGRALSLLVQWLKFKNRRKSRAKKLNTMLAFVDTLRYPGIDREAIIEPQYVAKSDSIQVVATTSTSDAASDLNQCKAVHPSVVAAVEDGLGLATLERDAFNLDDADLVRLNTRPCLCPCALDLLVWIWGCLSITIGFAAQKCREQSFWSPFFVLIIAAILVVADVLFFVLAYLYNRIKPGSWKFLSFLYIMMLIQHLMLLSLFFIGAKTISFFIVFIPLFLIGIAILFLCCVFNGIKKGVIFTVGLGFPLLTTLSLVCLKGDLLFNDAPPLPKRKFITWLDTYWPVWSILVVWPMIAWMFDRLLRCDACIGKLDSRLRRIQMWCSP